MQIVNKARIAQRTFWYVFGLACVAFILGCSDGTSFDDFGRVEDGGDIPYVSRDIIVVYIVQAVVLLLTMVYIGIRIRRRGQPSRHPKAITLLLAGFWLVSAPLTILAWYEMSTPREYQLGSSEYPIWMSGEPTMLPWYITEVWVMTEEDSVLHELAAMPLLNTVHFQRPLGDVAAERVQEILSDISYTEDRPRDIQTWINILEYYERKRDHERATDIYEQVILWRGNHKYGWGDAAKYSASIGEVEDAITCYNKATADGDNSDATYAGSMYISDQRGLPEALKWLDRIDRRNKESVAIDAKGDLYRAENQHHKALSFYEEYLVTLCDRHDVGFTFEGKFRVFSKSGIHAGRISIVNEHLQKIAEYAKSLGWMDVAFEYASKSLSASIQIAKQHEYSKNLILGGSFDARIIRAYCFAEKDEISSAKEELKFAENMLDKDDNEFEDQMVRLEQAKLELKYTD